MFEWDGCTMCTVHNLHRAGKPWEAIVFWALWCRISSIHSSSRSAFSQDSTQLTPWHPRQQSADTTGDWERLSYATGMAAWAK